MDISDKHLGICHGGDGRKKSMGSTEGTEDKGDLDQSRLFWLVKYIRKSM